MDIKELSYGTCLKGRYEILSVLGHGGFGIVYKAVDNLIGRYVAIKASKTSLSKEAKILKHLKNVPYIAHIYDYFRDNGSDYIVMQLIKGNTLTIQRDDSKVLYTKEEVMSYIPYICMALYQMHNLHIIHRDISPGNMMLTSDNSVYLIDFGTATSIKHDHLKNTLSFSHKGLDAPERTDERLMGPGTDIYSLCATIIYMISGEGIPEVSERRKYDMLPAFLSRLPFSKRQQNSLLKGLHIDVNKRYKDMLDFMNDFFGADNDIVNTSVNYNIYYDARTDIGSRKCNQDNFMVDKFFSYAGEDCHIFGTFPSSYSHIHIVAIADGVAGSSYGEFASKAAIQAISHFIDSYRYSDTIPNTLLEELLNQLNEKILILGEKIGKTATTVSILMWKDNNYYIANIGDSPIYMLRGTKLNVLSKTQTLSTMKLSKGEVPSPSDFHTLTSFLGRRNIAGSEMAHFGQGILSPGDTFLICSDGVSNQFTDIQLKRILGGKKEKVLQTLWKKMEKNTSKDNSTAIYLKFE